MKNCDAQGCKAQGVSFTVVNDKSIGFVLVGLEVEVEDVYEDVDGWEKIAKHCGAGGHGEEDEAGGED